MLKAVRLLQQNMAAVNNMGQQEADSAEGSYHDSESSEVTEEVETETDSDDDSQLSTDKELDEDRETGQSDLDLPLSMPYRHMSCIVHTLQLTVKPACKHYETLLSKTRRLVGKIRKSSVAMEKLVAKCGRSVILDCTTRWNSTHSMIKRLTVVKSAVNEVLCEMGKRQNCELVIFMLLLDWILHGFWYQYGILLQYILVLVQAL